MRRSIILLTIAALSPAAGVLAWLGAADRAAPIPQAGPELPRGRVPLTQVVLFNTGVGYFQREGTVEGSSRVDLSFPATDINDLLKTLCVDDGGKPGVVSFDGPEQLEQGLQAFALDLSSNPTFGQILNQARGAKVEVALESGTTVSPITGTIVGMEAAFENPTTEVHHLNVLASDGMRRVPLARVQRLRFLDPALEEEFRRALGVVAAGHANGRRKLSLHLAGEKKRKVKIGYVVETPIWKASYRLALDGKDGKPGLQGWAVVQNSSEEDWKDVRLALVSGRPITFRMDLAQPLFVPRPNVEPEVFASLRPPVHAGAANPLGGFGHQGGFGAQFGGGGGFQLGGTPGTSTPAPGAGMAGMTTPVVKPGGLFNRYQVSQESSTRPERLSWEELLQRRNQAIQQQKAAREAARQVGSSAVGMIEALESLASDADRIGEGFRYSLADGLSLPRQNSALVPMLDGPIAVTRFSVFDRNVHPRFPFFAVRLKNTTDRHLLQGPLAVFEGGAYAGDCRLPDLAPGEERFLSYAMDLGVEVRSGGLVESQRLERLEIFRGQLHSYTRHTKETPYQIRNRSSRPRTLLVEHPASRGWDVAGKGKVVESTAQAHRVEWTVAAGTNVREAVTLERTEQSAQSLAAMSDDGVRACMRHEAATKPMQEALVKILDYRERLAKLREQRTASQEKLDALSKEQGRLRYNISMLAAGSPAHKHDKEKHDRQEPQVEQLQKLLVEQHVGESKLKAEYDTYLVSLTVR